MDNQNRTTKNKDNDGLRAKWRNALMYFIITGDDSEMRTPEFAEFYNEHLLRLETIVEEWNMLTRERNIANN